MNEELEFKKIKLPRKKQELPDSPILDHLQEQPASKTKSVTMKSKSSNSEAPPTSSASAPKEKSSKTSSDPDAAKTKMTTAVMVNEALQDLKNRKGTSMYAIKKYMEAKYNVDPDKIGSLVKRYLKIAVERGDIVQTKGVGATGSFKLDTKAKKPRKEKKKLEKKTDEDAKKTKTKDKEKKDKVKEKKDTVKEKTVKDKKIITKEVKEKGDKKKATKFSKDLKSPKKTTKGPQARRKSLGSIVKAPQMKPKTPKKPKITKQKAA